MSYVYFIGDTHFDHKNVCKYRPNFSSLEEHNETIYENIMSVLNKRAVLYLLGDICFSYESTDFLRGFLSTGAQVKWALGNHDTETSERRRVQLEFGSQIEIFALKKYKGFWLSHAPVHPDELRDKKNIHGHVHAKTIPDDRYINVSCENVGFKPVTLDDIRAGFR